MPSKQCTQCKRLHDITVKKLKLVNYAGDYVCSKECVLSWIYSCLPNGVASYSGVWFPYGVDSSPDFKSQYEVRFAEWLSCLHIRWGYELVGFHVGDSKTYTPDFYLPDYDCFLETKGKWGVGGKKKMAMVKRQYPDMNILVVPWPIENEFHGFASLELI